MTSVETERVTPRRVPQKTDRSSAPKRLRSPVDQQRGEFLRRCRARIDPAELGLPGSRTRSDTQEEAPADVVRLVSALSVPASAMNLRWDVLAWNRLNSKLYRDYATIALEERNLLEILLAQPVRHLNPKALESTARRLVARLRFDYSKHADDPKFEALIRRLSNRSPLFRRMWRMPEFTLRPFGIHRFNHPRYGELAFEHTSCTPDGHPHIRMVICTPENAAARAAIAQVESDGLSPAT